MSHQVERARSEVIQASLHLAAIEWDNGRQTAGHSMSLDLAQDLLSDALDRYVGVVNEQRAGVLPQ